MSNALPLLLNFQATHRHTSSTTPFRRFIPVEGVLITEIRPSNAAGVSAPPALPLCAAPPATSVVLESLPSRLLTLAAVAQLLSALTDGEGNRRGEQIAPPAAWVVGCCADRTDADAEACSAAWGKPSPCWRCRWCCGCWLPTELLSAGAPTPAASPKRGGALASFALLPKTCSDGGSAAGAPWSPTGSTVGSSLASTPGAAAAAGNAVAGCGAGGDAAAATAAAAERSPASPSLAGEAAAPPDGATGGAEFFGGVLATLGVLAKAASISSSTRLVSATGVVTTAWPAAAEAAEARPEGVPRPAGARAGDSERAMWEERGILVTPGDAERGRDPGNLLLLPLFEERGVRGS